MPLKINHDCNGPGIKACGWTTSTQVDDLAARSQSALTHAAGQEADRHCWTGPAAASAHARSCVVQVLSGSHSVSISLDPEVANAQGTISLVGTRYSVQVD